MTQASTRLEGRVRRIYRNNRGDSWGTIETKDWCEFFWHSSEVQGANLGRDDIVTFTPVAPRLGHKKPMATQIRLEQKAKAGA